MKIGRIIMLGVSVAVVLGLLVGVAYGTVTHQSYQQNGYGSQMMESSNGGAMMGRASNYAGGMMGSTSVTGNGAGVTGGRGTMNAAGMMGGCAQFMQGYSNSTWKGTAGEVLVVIAGYGFHPTNVTVAKGTTVTWVNMDFVQHTVTSGAEGAATGLFDSHELTHMQSFSYSFTTPGVYAYYCDLHSGMVGEVVVTG